MDWQARNAAYWANGGEETGASSPAGTYIAPSVSAGHIGADSNPDQTYGANYTHEGYVVPSAAEKAAALRDAAIRNTQVTIDQMPELLRAALEAEGISYGNTRKGFDSAEGTQRDTYGKSTTTNQLNFDSNFMDSIRSGIKGLGGLMALLRGTGAGGGSAEEEARNAVGGVTANDIRTGADTQKDNQVQLDTSMSSFLTDLDRKRRLAEDTRVNNERAIRRDSSTQLQDLFGKMAGFFGDAGNTGEATNWMNRAGALTPEIAANSRTSVTPYDNTPITVEAPKLSAFTDPTQPSVVTSPTGQVGAGIFTTERRRKEASPVGA